MNIDLHLQSWFHQRFNMDNNKSYAGYFIPLNGNPRSDDNYISLFFELKNQNMDRNGWAELKFSSETSKFITVLCEQN